MSDRDQARRALSELYKAWEKCREAGISEDVLRTATLTAAIAHLVSEAGEEGAAQLIGELPAKIRAGVFSEDPGTPPDVPPPRHRH